MPSKARRDVIDESEVGAYHVYSRTVRRSFLLGKDPRTGQDYRHRKDLLLKRLALLLEVFAIDCLDSAVLDTHFHLILRNRPDLVAQWSDQEVAERWLRLNRAELDLRPPPSADEIAGLMADAAALAKARQRLSSISWLMAYLKEPLARVFNFEDDTDGHFWAARFGCVRLTTETSLLACSLYVAMNPVRAGMAKSVETSEYTSLHARLLDRQSGDPERPRSGFLAAVHVDGDGYAGAAVRRRPSDQGYLGLTFDEYVELVDSLIQRERAERAGQFEATFPPVLARLGITRPEWEATLRLTSRRFMRTIERSRKLRAEARGAVSS